MTVPSAAARVVGRLGQARQGRDAAGGVQWPGLVREACAASEGEGTVRVEFGAEFARLFGLQRQGVVDGEVADLERRRLRMARVPVGERHFQHGGRGEDRATRETVVGEPGLQRGVEQPRPAAGLRAVAEAEQRVFGDRVRQPPSLGGKRDARRACG